MIQRLSHLVLFCRDTAASLSWYQAAGFSLAYGHQDMYFLHFGSAQIMLHPSEQGPAGHAPEIYAAVADLDAHFAAVRTAGLVPDHHQVKGPLDAPHTTPWGSREFGLTDPDGHRWGFVQG